MDIRIKIFKNVYPMLNGYFIFFSTCVICSIAYSCMIIFTHKKEISTNKQELGRCVISAIVIFMCVLFFFLPKSIGLWIFTFGVQGFYSNYITRNELPNAIYSRTFAWWSLLILVGIIISADLFTKGTNMWFK